MARSAGVWGIDIGRCALKALRCRLDGDVVVADAFDYIEYPKLLTQPDADAVQLVKEALEQFLSRNNLRGDRVAISVPGESGLARYFKPPPVDVKKLADLVKFEAKQQIPFALEDVIWDYERMPGSQEVDGFVMESEVGLFAMKREQVAKVLKPLLEAEIEVDHIQLAPIAVYNFFAHDLTKPLPEGKQYDAEAPPESTVILSIGTETTDLVVTNGFRLWQRNIPLGGNHFTKQLSKELKLTFAKAEHLKRNPRQAEDPKAIFQAMRPVFGDMVTEVQRSIGFFQSLDRKAKITSILMLGNTVKLPGLTQYLGKHLGYEIQDLDAFRRLTGAAVVTSPSFKDNMLAFGTCYGLCVQGLGKSNLKTNLLPKEVTLQRIVKAKKPWAVAGAAAIVLACAINFIFHYRTWEQVHLFHEHENVTWQAAIDAASQVNTVSAGYTSEDEKRVLQLKQMQSIGNEVVGAADRRVLWLEVMKALNASLPEMAPPGRIPVGQIPDHLQLPFTQRRDLKIEYLETQHFPDLSVWFTDTVKRRYIEQNPELLTQPGIAAVTDPAGTQPGAQPVSPSPLPVPGAPQQPGGYIDPNAQASASATDVSNINIPAPTGSGWVFEIKGYHFFNDPSNTASGGSAHVKKTLLRSLEHGFIDLPSGPGGPPRRFTFKELGIGYAILARDIPINRSFRLENPNYAPPANGTGLTEQPGIGPMVEDPKNPQYFTVPKCEFVVQFCWQEKPLNERIKAQEEAAKAAQAAAAAAAANPVPATAPGLAPAPAPGQAPAPAPGLTPGPAPAPGPGPAPIPAPMNPIPAPIDPAAAPPIDPAAAPPIDPAAAPPIDPAAAAPPG